jgi:Tyrosine-protein kinase ephrin type A/B receptor-like
MKPFLTFLVGFLAMREAGGRQAEGDSTRLATEFNATTKLGDGSVRDDVARTTFRRSRNSHDSPVKRRMSCPIGTFNDPLGGSCQSCPLGSYSDEEASDHCTLCPSGSYAPITGASFCLPCDPSYYDGPGSDFGYTGVSAAASVSMVSNDEHSDGNVVFCVAPLYPVSNADEWTHSTDSPTSSTPSTVPTLSPSMFTSSSPPSAVPSIGVPSPPPTTAPSPTGIFASRPTLSPSLDSNLPWPWNSRRTQAPSRKIGHSQTSTPAPTVRRRWNSAEDARVNRTDGGDAEDEDGPVSVVEETDHRLRPFLPLLALSAAITISGVAFAIKFWRHQQQQRRQLVTKTFSLRPISKPPSAAPHTSPPPPLPASASSKDLSFLSCQQEEDSDGSHYWSGNSSLDFAESPNSGSDHSHDWRQRERLSYHRDCR